MARPTRGDSGGLSTSGGVSMIVIKLSAGNMGITTERQDYDAWTAYVRGHVEEALDLGDAPVTVQQYRWLEAGRASDEITGATDEQEDAIRDWLLHAGWDAWLADT